MKNNLLNMVFAAAIALVARADDIRVLNGDAHFPEGPVWHHGKLYYVEYDRNTVTTWDGEKNTIFRKVAGRPRFGDTTPFGCAIGRRLHSTGSRITRHACH